MRRLHRHCDGRFLSIPQRLRVFLTACSAVGYARERFSLYQDLRTASILVTGRGTAKLLGFAMGRDLGPSRSIQRPLTTRQPSPWFSL